MIRWLCGHVLRHPLWGVYGYSEGRFLRFCRICKETW